MRLQRLNVPVSKSKEDLLKLLEEAPEGQSKVAFSDDVLAFISKYNIVEGENTVPEKTVYRLYKSYSKSPLSQQEFVAKFKEILVRHRTSYTFHYKLNLDAMRISEEILKLTNAKKQDKTKNLQYVRTFENFLSKYSIERGNNWLEGFVLYELFVKPYRASGKRTPLGYRQFLNFCRLYFDEKRIGSGRVVWFGISDGILKKVSVEQVQRIRRRKERDVEKKRRSKKENREKKSRIEKEKGEVPSVKAGTEPKE